MMKRSGLLLIVLILLGASGCGAVGRSLGKAARGSSKAAGKSGSNALRNSAKVAPAVPLAGDAVQSGRRAFSSADDFGSSARRAADDSDGVVRDSLQTAGEIGVEAATSGDDDK